MRALLPILRPALAPTAAADVCVVAAVVGVAPSPRWAAAAAASMCLYTGGMAQNDLADRKRDATIQPDRSLVRHPELVGRARALCLVLFAAGIGLGAVAGSWLGALIVAAGATLYNLGLKARFPANVLSMGATRTANVAFGVLALHGTMTAAGWWYAGAYGLYIAAVTGASLAEDIEAPSTVGLVLLMAFGVQFVACGALATLAPTTTAALWMLVPVLYLAAALRPAIAASNREAARGYVFRSLLGIFIVHSAAAMAAGKTIGVIAVLVAASATFWIRAAMAR